MNKAVIPGHKTITAAQWAILENLRDCLFDLTVWAEAGCDAENDDDFHAVAKESRRYEQALRDTGLSHLRVENITRAIRADVRRAIFYS